MLMKYLIAFYFFFAFQFSYSQAPSIQWQKLYGGSGDENFNSAVETENGGYLIVGGTSSKDGDIATGFHPKCGGSPCGWAWAMKFDSIGTLVWNRFYGGSVGDQFNSVTKCLDGNYLLAGATVSTDGDVSGYHQGTCYMGNPCDDIW